MNRLLPALFLAAASCKAADVYLQSGYQRTGPGNDPYFGAGVSVTVGEPVKFTGEFSLVPLASGQFTYMGSAGSFTASGRAGLVDIGGGLRVRLKRGPAYEFYGL